MIRGPKTSLTLERKTKTRDAAGGYTETWADVAEYKGVLCTLSGNEILKYYKMTVEATHNFYLDFIHGETITEQDRFYDGTRTFEILFVNNIGANQSKALKILLKEET
jgi:SPP1 family predicted phage head-tail adaptor